MTDQPTLPGIRDDVVCPDAPLAADRARPWQKALLVTGLLLWAICVTLFGLGLVGVPLGVTTPITPLQLPPQMTMAALLTVALAVAAVMVTVIVRPAAFLKTLAVLTILLLVAVAILTRTLLPLAVTMAICIAALATGHMLLVCINGAPSHPLPRATLSFGIGISLLGTLWLILGAGGVLYSTTVLVSTCAVLLGFILLAHHTRRPLGFTGQFNWGVSLSPLQALLLAAGWGVLLFAVLSAFVPETQSDAMRHHLPIAREFWQAHKIYKIPTMPVTIQPIQQHVLFSVAFGLGGQTAAQLLQAVFGLASVAGVSAMAWQVKGRNAAFIAAACFGLMPLVLWEVGHAFIDLLPVVLTASAILCLLQWQATGYKLMLVLAGGLCGVGIATKMTMAAVAVAAAVGIFLVGRQSWRWRDRFAAGVLFGLGTTALLPWLYVNYRITGTVPGLDVAYSRIAPLLSLSPLLANPIDAVSSAAPALGQSAGPLSGESEPLLGHHEMIDLLRMPWLLTFRGDSFGFPIIGRGEIGLAPLLLLPSLLFLPRRRDTALLGFIVAASFLMWWLTPLQIVRHLLPTLAIGAALLGIATATFLGGRAHGTFAKTNNAILNIALLICLALSPLFFLASPRAAVPVDLLLGTVSRPEYVRQSIDSATAILALDDLVPPDSPVAYLSVTWDAPQIYTEARLVYFDGNQAGTTIEETLATLDQLNIQHIIWERSSGVLRDSSAVIRSTPFLRQYTRILAGDNNAYLFEVLPDGNTSWGQTTVKNLLKDPRLQRIKSEDGPWVVEGKSVIAQGVVALSRRSTLTQETSVTPGNAYLLEAPVRCLDASGRGILTFHWLDTTGNVIGTASEQVFPGREISDQFLWRRAPDGSDSVRSEFSMAGPARCEFSGAALYDLG